MKIIIPLKIFKKFFRLQIVLDANHHYPEKIQRLFRLQSCLRCKSSSSWKYSKTFSPAILSQMQSIIILKIFKDFFACKVVLAANHHYPGKIQKFPPLQNCLSRKSFLSWKHSKTFSLEKLSYLQIVKILKLFTKLFVCKNVLDANHHYPEIIQRVFRLQNCLRCKSSLSWKNSKTSSPAKLS